MAAWAAATLAGSNFWRTGLAACMLSFAGFVVPFRFVYGPSILLIGSPIEILYGIVSTTIGVLLGASALAGGVYSWKELAKRCSAALGAILLLYPGFYSDMGGLFFGLLSLGPGQVIGWARQSIRFILHYSPWG